MSTYSDASLIFYPSGYKESKLYSLKPTDGSGDLTFTRASSATRVNEQGLIEGVITNLALRSEEFDNAVWAGTVGVTKLANQAIAPDGTNTMDLITFPLSNSSISQGINVVSGQTYTFSVWLSTQSGTVDAEIGNVNVGVYQSVTVTTTPTRFTITQNASAATRYPSIRAINPCSLLVWGGQLQEGSSATEYIKTEGTAVSVGMLANVPRIDYTSGCGKLLLEPQRTNLLLQSENISSASWIKGGAIITPNAATSPDGTINADLVSGVAGKSFYQSSIAVTSSTLYTLSFYVKNVNLTNSKLAIRDDTNGAFIVQDIAYTISTDEWTRIVYTFTTPIGCLSARVYPLRSPTNTGSAYFWGGQLELGSYPTSYIPTTSTAVTRVADAASKSGISSLIGQTEGVLYAEIDFQQINAGGYRIFAYLYNNSAPTANRVRIEIEPTNKIWGVLNSSGVQTFLIQSNVQDAGNLKIAFAYKSGDSVLYINGLQIGTSSSTFSFSANLDSVSLVSYSGGNQSGNGVNEFVLFPTRLSDAELATLTTI